MTDPNAGLGTVGAFSDLAKYTNLGGTLTVFELGGDVTSGTTGSASVARQRAGERRDTNRRSAVCSCSQPTIGVRKGK